MRFYAMLTFAFLSGFFFGLNAYYPEPEQPVALVVEVRAEILDAPYVLPEGEKVELRRISAYNPVPRQTDGDPSVSSCGANKPRQIAVSQDLFFDGNGRKHLCGRRVTLVTDRGEVFSDYVIWDTMNARYSTTADVLLPHEDEAEAFLFGVTTGYMIIHDDSEEL